MSDLVAPSGKLERNLLPCFLADVLFGLSFGLFAGVWIMRRTAAIGYQCYFFAGVNVPRFP